MNNAKINSPVIGAISSAGWLIAPISRAATLSNDSDGHTRLLAVSEIMKVLIAVIGILVLSSIQELGCDAPNMSCQALIASSIAAPNVSSCGAR